MRLEKIHRLFDKSIKARGNDDEEEIMLELSCDKPTLT
jgi:hypothetical protein